MKRISNNKDYSNVIAVNSKNQEVLDINQHLNFGLLSNCKHYVDDFSSINSLKSDFLQKFQTSIESYNLQQFKLDEYNSYSHYFYYDDFLEYTGHEKEFEQVLETELADVKQTISVSTEDLFVERYEDLLINTVCATKFISGEDNEATLLFANMMNESIDFSMKLLQEKFVSCIDKNVINEILASKILYLLQDYSYYDAHPYSQTMALAAINVNSIIIQSAAIGLFSHWGNEESLNMLRHMSEPSTPWVKIKYEAVKKSLENALRKKN
jgi:hypothetical protein